MFVVHLIIDSIDNCAGRGTGEILIYCYVCVGRWRNFIEKVGLYRLAWSVDV